MGASDIYNDPQATARRQKIAALRLKREQDTAAFEDERTRRYREGKLAESEALRGYQTGRGGLAGAEPIGTDIATLAGQKAAEEAGVQEIGGAAMDQKALAAVLARRLGINPAALRGTEMEATVGPDYVPQPGDVVQGDTVRRAVAPQIDPEEARARVIALIGQRQAEIGGRLAPLEEKAAQEKALANEPIKMREFAEREAQARREAEQARSVDEAIIAAANRKAAQDEADARRSFEASQAYEEREARKAEAEKNRKLSEEQLRQAGATSEAQRKATEIQGITAKLALQRALDPLEKAFRDASAGIFGSGNLDEAAAALLQEIANQENAGAMTPDLAARYRAAIALELEAKKAESWSYPVAPEFRGTGGGRAAMIEALRKRAAEQRAGQPSGGRTSGANPPR